MSVLNDTKKALGLAEDYTAFDPEIIMHINSVLADIHQLGIGPAVGASIANAQNGWDEVIGSDIRLNNVKSLLFLKVKMLFDPPNIGYVLTSMEKMIEKAEWRVNHAREEIDHPPVVEEETEEEI